MTTTQEWPIDVERLEDGLFPPAPDFVKNARISSRKQYEALYEKSVQRPEQFWGKLAREELHWFEPFRRTLIWNAPYAQWFVGGKTNASYNCLDRQLDAGLGQRTAILWEGEPTTDRRSITYAELHREVCRFANALRALGIESGDRVSIYLPMIPELVVAMLACARIGAVHTVIFAGFSAQAIADRNNDSNAKLLITSDAAWRRGRQLPLKRTVDEALENSPSVEGCVVLRRTGLEVEMTTGRDYWWHDVVQRADDICPAIPMDSEAPLFILYTSGSTAKPKGIAHSTAGYQLYAKTTFQWVFDHRDDDVFWCTADIGWVTGHSYVVYGPLAAGATVLMYEGAPDYPAKDRFWEIVERYGVTIFHTAPTAIRAFIKWGDEYVDKHDLSSLRLIGTVGEGINPKAWVWYHQKVGHERCPIVDTWWQTETGATMLSPLPGAVATKPGSCAMPLPGVVPRIIDGAGRDVDVGESGQLVISQPWPGMLRGIWGDDSRFHKTYWKDAPGCYATGDNARRDRDGYYWIMGRTDDVMNVSGHRLSSIEIESALVSHRLVAEAAVVGRPDELKGEAVTAFVTLCNAEPSDQLRSELKTHVRKLIGPLAAPDEIRFAEAVPKTRSGKIMRRLLRDIAAGRKSVGDTTTLEDGSVLDQLRHEQEG